MNMEEIKDFYDDDKREELAEIIERAENVMLFNGHTQRFIDTYATLLYLDVLLLLTHEDDLTLEDAINSTLEALDKLTQV